MSLLDLICWLVAAIVVVYGNRPLGATIVITLIVIVVLRILVGERPPYWPK